jgi:hypothetical protein
MGRDTMWSAQSELENGTDFLRSDWKATMTAGQLSRLLGLGLWVTDFKGQVEGIANCNELRD